MGLSDLKIARREIPMGDSSFEVYGLSASDVMTLVAQHAPAAVGLFAKISDAGITGQSLEEKPEEVQQLVVEACVEFPELIGAIIALAADDYTESGLKIARKMPMDVQLQAIFETFNLTFESEGGVKKFAETLILITNGMKTTISTLTNGSGTGIGVSGES